MFVDQLKYLSIGVVGIAAAVLLVKQLQSNRLHNSYFVMRHGHSTANEAKIISCVPSIAVNQHGLTETGRTQAADAAAPLKKLLSPDRPVLFISSDFLRARETAEAVMAELAIDKRRLVLSKLLRERDFGVFAGESDENYERVWQKDAEDASHRLFDNESVLDVMGRLKLLLKECETHHSGVDIVFVAHGDVLQICECIMLDLPPSQFKQINYLPNAGVRKLS